MAGYWKQAIWALAIALVASGATAIGFVTLSHNRENGAVQGVGESDPMAPQQMKLLGQFHGPLKDTVVQRWEDPSNGTICYIYLPIVVQHSAPTSTGFVQYGPNHIGSISCLPPR